MYRIGDVMFGTRDEAEAWVEAGNIGGTYTIVRLGWCGACESWRDWVDASTPCPVCETVTPDCDECHEPMTIREDTQGDGELYWTCDSCSILSPHPVPRKLVVQHAQAVTAELRKREKEHEEAKLAAWNAWARGQMP